MFKSENEALRSEKARLDDLVSRVQADKQRLGERVSKLTTSERELILELERVKSLKAVGKGAASGGRGGARASSPSKAVERLRRELETDRDYWRGECDLLQQMLLDLKSRAVSFSGSSAGAGAKFASPAAAGKGLAGGAKGARPASAAATGARARSPSPPRKTGSGASIRGRSTSRERPPSRSVKRADDKGVDIVDSGRDSISTGSERTQQTDKKVRF